MKNKESNPHTPQSAVVLEPELADMVADSDLDDIRAFSDTFRRWDHQLAIAQNIRATRPDAFIILEPELHLRWKKMNGPEVDEMRAILRRWDRQLRVAYAIRLNRREIGHLIADTAPCGRIREKN